jgi:hypothetical protein
MNFSPLKTIWVDWPALGASVGIPIFWAIALIFPHLPTSRGQVPTFLTVAITVGLAAIIAWRLGRIARLFSVGRSAPGAVTDLQIAKDRGRLMFVFQHEGKSVHSWTPVHKSKAVMALQPGQAVDVLFDPDRPNRAIVRHLYEGPG